MFRHPVYLTYGALMLGFASMAEYRGWSLMKLNEVKNVPRSVRENPGAYRSIYHGIPHYSGGK
jgi:hypothetical protein